MLSMQILSDCMIEIRLFGEQDLEGYTLIEGFPGVGLVGPMANSYIIENLNMEYIGYIYSDGFPPITTIHGNKPMFPVRVYKDEKDKLAVIISEFTIPTGLVYQLAEEITEFVRKHKIEEIISIGGIPNQKPKDAAYFITSGDKLSDRIKKSGITPIEEGVVAGVSAILLVNGAQYNIPTVDLLVEVNPTIMDPKYAEVAILNLNKIINVKINTEELEREAKLVEAKVREILKNTKDSHESYTKAVDATGPSMYA